MGLIYDQLVEDYGAVTYEAFINLLVSKLHQHLALSLILGQVEITEDQTSPAQLRESFRGIANDKVRLFFILLFAAAHSPPQSQPFVTELDLRLAHLPQSSVDYLREVMPSAQNGAGEPEYDYETWLDDVFA